MVDGTSLTYIAVEPEDAIKQECCWFDPGSSVEFVSWTKEPDRAMFRGVRKGIICIMECVIGEDVVISDFGS